MSSIILATAETTKKPQLEASKQAEESIQQTKRKAQYNIIQYNRNELRKHETAINIFIAAAMEISDSRSRGGDGGSSVSARQHIHKRYIHKQ